MSGEQRFHLYVTERLHRQQRGGTRIQAISWVGGQRLYTPTHPVSSFCGYPQESPGLREQSWEYNQAGLTTDTSGRVLTLPWVVSPFPSRSNVFWKWTRDKLSRQEPGGESTCFLVHGTYDLVTPSDG